MEFKELEKNFENNKNALANFDLDSIEKIALKIDEISYKYSKI